MKVFENTDWALLREQKKAQVELVFRLRELLDEELKRDETMKAIRSVVFVFEIEAMEGILNWVDALQDEAVKRQPWIEKEVFGSPEEE